MARRSNTQNTNRMMQRGKSPFAEGSTAAKIDYAVTRNIQNVYTKLFGAKFDPLYPDRQVSRTPRTRTSGASGISKEVEAFRQNETSSHIINTNQKLGEIKGILTEMSKTLKEIKTAVEESGGGGILDTIIGGLRSLFTRGRSGGGPSIPGARPSSAISPSGIPGALTGAGATGALFGLNEFMNPAVEQLEGIREKLESENTIAVKFSKTSETAKDLEAIAENTEVVAKKYNPTDPNSENNSPPEAKKYDQTKPISENNLPPGFKYDSATGAAYLEKSNDKRKIDDLLSELKISPAAQVAPAEPAAPAAPAAPVAPAAPSWLGMKLEPAPMPAPPAPVVQSTNKAERERVGGKRGKDHIGYGHRLTDEELRTGKIKLPDGTELDVNRGITKEEAEKLYDADRAKLDDLTRKTLKKRGVDLDQLPPNVQEVVKDMGFNGPAIFNKNPKLIEGLKKGQSTGDYGDLAETVRESMHTADGKVLKGLVKRANDRADAILDPNKKLETKKFEGLETQTYDPLVPKTKIANPTQNINENLTEIKTSEDVLNKVPTAKLDPTQRITGPVLGNMETQLANARDQTQAGGAPTIINNTTNNTSSVGGGGGMGPVASVRNEENSFVRMQNMIAAGALS